MADAGPTQGRPPNVLFVFADQLGADYLGCYGHPLVRTPNLDRLAASSWRFRSAYTASPLCTPFRGTLFTGRYPVQTGIVRNEQRMASSETPLATLFARAGYATAYVGKWHLAGTPRKIWVPPADRGGFEDFVGWDCGHVRHVDQKYFDGDSPEILTLPGHETDALTDVARERLERHAAGDRPFCMFVSYQAPHPFCDPPQEYLDPYRDRPLPRRPNVNAEARFHGYGEESADIGLTEWMERYLGEITHLDAAVGRLLDDAESRGLLDDTIVVFTSDHGDMAGSHGRFEKSVAYEEAVRIPLLVRLPGRPEGRETGALFSSVDFLPTLLGLCGLPPAESAEGVDYAPLLRGDPDAPQRERLIMQCGDWACIREGECKLTTDTEGVEAREFYRLEADPFEQRNLVDAPGERATVDRLRSAYREWLADARRRAVDPADDAQ